MVRADSHRAYRKKLINVSNQANGVGKATKMDTKLAVEIVTHSLIATLRV